MINFQNNNDLCLKSMFDEDIKMSNNKIVSNLGYLRLKYVIASNLPCCPGCWGQNLPRHQHW